jgi:NADPH:quinone reductase
VADWRAVRVVRVHTIGEPPELEEIGGPMQGDGEVLVRVRAVSLNPVDAAVATGRFYGGHPPLPYVVGAEAVGELDGSRVYLFGAGLGIARDGTLAEWVSVPATAVYDVREGVDDAHAVACGIAGVAGWLPVATRADVSADDAVVVLGATGTAGSVAVQAARLRGARRVVAVGRRPDRLERARELGADATVSLDPSDDLGARIADASGEPPTVVIDFLWATPFAAALEAAAPGARAVNVGQSAGPETTLASGTVRGKQLDILGHSNFALSHDAIQAAYAELTSEVAAGRISIDLERYPLERVAEAWDRQLSGQAAKVVITL